MKPLAIVPARTGSRGIPHKNQTPILGESPVARACKVARQAGCRVLITSDATAEEQARWAEADIYHSTTAHTDTSAMIDIVKDALAVTSEAMILLVQPTQVLRRPKHLTKAIQMLMAKPRVDSVVSLTSVPAKYHPLWQLRIEGEYVRRCMGSGAGFPARRQMLDTTYIRDGTVYAFWRETVTRYNSIYGRTGRPLIVPAAETCSLDTLEDWALAERLIAAPRVR